MQDPAAPALRLPSATADELRAGVEAKDARAVREVVFRLDQGTLRVAEKGAQGWVIHGFIQQAINQYFGLRLCTTKLGAVRQRVQRSG